MTARGNKSLPLCRGSNRQRRDEYFIGERRLFDVPLDFQGTAFQKSVRAELVAIPYGETHTYGTNGPFARRSVEETMFSC